MTKQLMLYADANGNITADTAGSTSTIPMRDTDGLVTNLAENVNSMTVKQELIVGQHATVTATAAFDFTAIVWPFDATSGAQVPTLPPASSCLGQIYICKRISIAANNVTITPNGADTIDGAATYVLAAQWSCVWLFAIAGGWLIIAKM